MAAQAEYENLIGRTPGASLNVEAKAASSAATREWFESPIQVP
jgi:hypothetical protein